MSGDDKRGGKGPGKGPERPIVRAARIALATGIAWTIAKSFKARREESALIEEYYGDRPDFVDPAALGERDFFLPASHAAASTVEADDEEKIKKKTGLEDSLVKPEHQKKPWFGYGKERGRGGKPEHLKSRSYQIRNGDTLWGISGKYGIPLAVVKAANGLSGDDIYAGDNLVIPAK